MNTLHRKMRTPWGIILATVEESAKKCYVVTWAVGDDSTRLKIVEFLKSQHNYCPIHRNAWAILSSESAAYLRNGIKPLLGQQDSVFVIRSGTAAAWYRSYGEKNDTWLKKNL